MASSKAQTAKDKGNTAFKAGDYPGAIGHYTTAIFADRNDHTYPLNRAAAYLKLGKNEDAERDCTTVLSLNSGNVKALFRRAQARVGLGKYVDAQRDLEEARKLEPANESVKQESKKVAELIDKEKATKSAPKRPASPPPANRRRIPITIIDPPTASSSSASTSKAPPIVKSNPTPKPKSALKSNPAVSGTNDDFMTPVSSRPLSAATASAGTKPAPTPAATPAPAPKPVPKFTTKTATFQDAKASRESAKPSHIVQLGGGIFRASGESTIFDRTPSTSPGNKGKDKDTGSRVSPTNDAVSKDAATGAKQTEPVRTRTEVLKAPMTLFNFTKAWDSLSGKSAQEERWKIISTIPPSSLPAMFQMSLEPALLAGLVEVFLSILKSDEPETEAIQEYMNALTKVPRFGTVLLFLSRKEKEVAREVCIRVYGDADGKSAWGAWGTVY